MQRLTVHFSGHVQGVGFRYSACRVAARFPVTGYVKNLPTGEVEMVAEGTAGQLRAFLAALQEDMAENIRETRVQESPGTGSFPEFGVSY